MDFNCLFIFPPCYVALCASKARHRVGSESVSWCLETSLFLRLPSRDGTRPSLFRPFFCLLYFSLPPFEDLGCFSGCLMSSAGIQKLFCGIYSAFKCSFDEFVWEKVFSLSYSSAILAPPYILFTNLNTCFCCSVLELSLTVQSHGQRSLAGYNPWDGKESDMIND